MFWPFTVFLFVLACLFIVVPLWLRRRAIASDSEELRAAANVALFHERNDELESDLATGAIDQVQFENLLAELQQKLLSDISLSDEAAAGSAKDMDVDAAVPGRLSYIIPLIFAVVIPLLAYTLYEQWGFIDDVEVMDLFQRTVNNVDDPEEARRLIVSLGEVVQQNEDMPWPWYFLAENFANIGLFQEAEIAYERSAMLLDDTPEKALVLGRVALAKYINADLSFTPEILEVIEQAREINPSEVSILQLLAADAEQQADWPRAIEYWRLLIQVNPNSQQAQIYRNSIAAAQDLMAEQQSDGAIVAGPVIEVNISLAEGVEANDNLRVFVAARNAEREGMPPLAATSLTVAELPATITLDNSSAVGPFNLASADTVYISVLVSNAGIANPQSGDLRVVSDNFAHNGQRAVIDLVVAERVP